MDYTGTINALLRAVGFKISGLTVRLLQERGASELDTYATFRYALIPSFIWCLVFVRKDDLVFIINSPRLLVIFAMIVLLFNSWAFLKSQVINSTNSMVLYSTLNNALTLPFFLAFGTFFNNDRPNIYSLSAILMLVIAVILKPAPHRKNKRTTLSKPLVLIAFLIILNASCSTVLDGISREALKQIHPTVFLGVYSVTTLSVCAFISRFFIKTDSKREEVLHKNKGLVLLAPMLWFVSSIPEAFALAALPIYTVISIGAVTFSMDTFSDVFRKRISLNLRTLSFITLVLLGTYLSVLSISVKL